MNNKEPLFKSVFGSAWEKLSPVFYKRYGNRPFTNDIATVEGKMEITFSKIIYMLIPFFRIFHILVPYQGKNIPVVVDFSSQINSPSVCLNRIFYFPSRKPYKFDSCVQIIKDNIVMERMAFNMGWKARYFYDGKNVVMQHIGYVWQILGLNIPLPLELIIGKTQVKEEPINDDTYRITMTLDHALFGTMYNYSGHFTFKRLPS